MLYTRDTTRLQEGFSKRMSKGRLESVKGSTGNVQSDLSGSGVQGLTEYNFRFPRRKEHRENSLRDIFTRESRYDYTMRLA